MLGPPRPQCWALCFLFGSVPLHQHLRGPSLVAEMKASSLLFCTVSPVLWDLLREPLVFFWFVLT